MSDVDIALGFDYINAPGYLRFPLWLLFLFPVDADHAAIKNTLDGMMKNIRKKDTVSRKFCAMICSHDRNGIREKLMKAISKIDRVDSAGKYLNNTEDLKKLYGDDKHIMLYNYKFNICPENTNAYGYVTEKLFDAIAAGTIPVYWGSNSKPEPEVLNEDAILFFQGSNTLPQLVARIDEFHKNQKLYREFLMQDRFKPHAAAYIAEIFEALECKIKQVVKKAVIKKSISLYKAGS